MTSWNPWKLIRLETYGECWYVDRLDQKHLVARINLNKECMSSLGQGRLWPQKDERDVVDNFLESWTFLVKEVSRFGVVPAEWSVVLTSRWFAVNRVVWEHNRWGGHVYEWKWKEDGDEEIVHVGGITVVGTIRPSGPSQTICSMWQID